MVDTSDEWIKKRTGIKERHIADKDETQVIWLLKLLKSACPKVVPIYLQNN